MKSTGVLSKVILVITVGVLGMLIAGFVPQRWLLAEFDLKVNGSSLAVSRPYQVYSLVPNGVMSVFNDSVFTFHVISKMGLFTNCKDRTASIWGNSLVEYSCDGDGAADWQKIAFAMAALSLLFGTACVIMSVMAAFMKRFQCNIKFRFATLIVNFSTGFLALTPAILYAINRKIQVKPPLPDVVTFNIGWALLLNLASAAVCGFVVLLNAFMITVLGHSLKQGEDGFCQSVKMDALPNGVIGRF